MPICGSSHVREEAEEKAHLSAGSQVGPFQDARPQSSQATITSALAADPTLAPSIAAKQLFPVPSAAKRGILRFKIKEQLEEGRGKHWVWDKGAVHHGNREPDDDELERVRLRYGYKPTDQGGPSRLYLMVLADCLLPLPRNPMSGVVSPPLLATTGIAPLSIFSTGPDIIGHYYDCIVAARREVILLTNYWQGGKNVDRIAEALRELNKRVEKRRKQQALDARRKGHSGPAANPSQAPQQEKAAQQQTDLLEEQGAPGSVKRTEKDHDQVNGELDDSDIDLGPPTAEERVVVKLMWDRGPQTLADLFRLRKPVPPGMWKDNGLPTESEIPNLTMEILNYHRPLMGTFHAKLLIVDRQVALINSNNIQDRPNVEACVRLEGDIVNSIYDHALISWGNPLQPPLPCLTAPAPVAPSAAAFMSGKESTLPSLTVEKLKQLALNVRQRLHDEDTATEVEKERSMQSPMSFHFGDVVDQVMRRDSFGGTKGAAPAIRVSPSEHPVDGEKAARNAGALWAHKVLGERFSHFQSSNLNKPERTESEPPSHDKAEQPQTPHHKKHFADMVEALMKKEGHKPPAWAEGALEVFGLGQSSSKNVAEAVRRNPRPKTTLASGANVPMAVAEDDHGEQLYRRGSIEAEEESLDDAPSHTVIDDGSASPKALLNSVSGDEAALDGNKDASSAGDDAAGKALEPTSDSNDGVAAAPALNTHVSQPKSEATAETTPPKDEETVPGSAGYRRVHRRTLSQISKSSAAERLSAITKSLDFANNSKVQGEIKAEQLSDEKLSALNAVLDFQPYVFHKPHEPVPMALVNRRPHGTPGHSDIRNPQDAAWLAGFRYAKKHVFIQSPTLNASPIKAAVLAAVRRHVTVELWLDLGFNDKSESMPFQGGTNEQVVTAFYRQLRREGKGDEKYLEVYWYTGKDMTRPLNAVRKQRNCHVKFAAFDGQVAVLGSGNQDTQSWFHSQEINVMVDSKQIVDEWMAALTRNQSTKLYGKVDQRDGIWRGRDGQELVDTGKDQTKEKSSPGTPPSHTSSDPAAQPASNGSAAISSASPPSADMAKA
ncbi:hypothetical protein PHSY_001835 [Pseudozyma hubeiensis SY62]|uniref:PLD phosphodiesterase domain-containing protein n=1 Tax=Pseudozyma hubeiensis (strain SY62) TaxID=1305764 RepID=R9NZN9_PSEHS|nr:hypothetical protein PHSY_001835 [Pseudozyma hubeiensis SY62]GAC94264.1 hypothetical protein PHSY_001835 [Pseudozyma hubeiensis SY62]